MNYIASNQMQQSFKKEVINKFKTLGEEKFLEYLIDFGMNKAKVASCSYTLFLKDISWQNGKSPDHEYFYYYDEFLIAYRREGVEEYLEIAEVFRRAANSMYRFLLEKKLISKNKKFFNLVK
jgi:hypothetical protein